MSKALEILWATPFVISSPLFHFDTTVNNSVWLIPFWQCALKSELGHNQKKKSWSLTLKKKKPTALTAEHWSFRIKSQFESKSKIILFWRPWDKTVLFPKLSLFRCKSSKRGHRSHCFCVTYVAYICQGQNLHLCRTASSRVKSAFMGCPVTLGTADLYPALQRISLRKITLPGKGMWLQAEALNLKCCVELLCLIFSLSRTKLFSLTAN